MVQSCPFFIRIFGSLFLVFVAVFMLAPLIVIIGASFSESQFISFPPKGLSFKWYEKIIASSDYLASLGVSLTLALFVTIAASLVGGMAAIALFRRTLPFSDMLALFFLSPLMLPTLIYAMGMLMFWSTLFGALNLYVLWISHTVIALPYIVRTTLAVLEKSDPYLEEAARTMGAGRAKVLWLVIMPQARPGLAAGAFFAFNISFDEAVLSLFLRSPTLTTLPVRIYGQLEFSPDPSIAAVSALMIGLTIVMLLAIERCLGIGKFSGV